VSALKPAVNVVQWFAAAAAVAFVVLLFVNEPDDEASGGGAGAGATGAVDASGVDGATVFADRCSGCHGGDGGGGTGPQLSGGRVVERFPDVADEIAVVTEGRGGMPSFGDDLSPAEIQAVVDYTRTL